MTSKEVTIGKVDDRYENPTMELIHVACQYTSAVYLVSGSHRINAKSMLGVMAFWPQKGDSVMVEAEGADEQDAIAGIVSFFED